MGSEMHAARKKQWRNLIGFLLRLRSSLFTRYYIVFFGIQFCKTLFVVWEWILATTSDIWTITAGSDVGRVSFDVHFTSNLLSINNLHWRPTSFRASYFCNGSWTPGEIFRQPQPQDAFQGPCYIYWLFIIMTNLNLLGYSRDTLYIWHSFALSFNLYNFTQPINIFLFPRTISTNGCKINILCRF